MGHTFSRAKLHMTFWGQIFSCYILLIGPCYIFFSAFCFSLQSICGGDYAVGIFSVFSIYFCISEYFPYFFWEFYPLLAYLTVYSHYLFIFGCRPLDQKFPRTLHARVGVRYFPSVSTCHFCSLQNTGAYKVYGLPVLEARFPPKLTQYCCITS